MNRRAGRFVHHDQRLILVGDHEIPWRNGGLRRALGGTHRWYTEFVSGLEAVLRRYAAFVQAMRQFEEFRQWPRPTQLFDDAEGHAAAAMYRDARRFVHHDERLVLERDFKIPCWNSCLDWTLGGADGWYAQPVTKLQPVLGRNPALIYPYLAAAQDAVDVALGHTLGDAQQVVVDALPLGLVANLKPGNRIFA